MKHNNNCFLEVLIKKIEAQILSALFVMTQPANGRMRPVARFSSLLQGSWKDTAIQKSEVYLCSEKVCLYTICLIWFCFLESFALPECHSQGAVEREKWVWRGRCCLEALKVNALPKCHFLICFLKDKRGCITRSKGRLPGKGGLGMRLFQVRDFLVSFPY